jgi:hypothetical protein
MILSWSGTSIAFVHAECRLPTTFTCSGTPFFFRFYCANDAAALPQSRPDLLLLSLSEQTGAGRRHRRHCFIRRDTI